MEIYQNLHSSFQQRWPPPPPEVPTTSPRNVFSIGSSIVWSRFVGSDPLCKNHLPLVSRQNPEKHIYTWLLVHLPDASAPLLLFLLFPRSLRLSPDVGNTAAPSARDSPPAAVPGHGSARLGPAGGLRRGSLHALPPPRDPMPLDETLAASSLPAAASPLLGGCICRPPPPPNFPLIWTVGAATFSLDPEAGWFNPLSLLYVLKFPGV
jgi:hypothetical protein